ncbi:MAG: MutS protein msh4 [Candelina submexicana]|nr:MAG: MutS protein msh4 [Candelina submexicana]
MAQIGCFVPAQYASFTISRQLFARVSMDDSIEANVSTFAAEMRETAFILRNIEKQSMVIVDELGRGTSTRDGLAIALAVAEALIESRALVWFATHFRELAHILSERNGVVNMHLAVEITEESTMNMLYTIAEGHVKEEHYGLALARVVALPESVLGTATGVSEELRRQSVKRQRGSRAFAINRRRKLILGLQESLLQASAGSMQGEVLSSWLRKLQEVFVLRMDAIEAEAQSAVESESEGENGMVGEQARDRQGTYDGDDIGQESAEADS